MSNLVKNMSAFDSFIRLKYKEGVWWNYGKPTHPLYADLWDAWQARVPEGYVVVPKEPTDEMVFKAQEDTPHFYHGDSWYGTDEISESQAIACYKAMIEAVEK